MGAFGREKLSNSAFPHEIEIQSIAREANDSRRKSNKS